MDEQTTTPWTGIGIAVATAVAYVFRRARKAETADHSRIISTLEARIIDLEHIVEEMRKDYSEMRAAQDDERRSVEEVTQLVSRNFDRMIGAVETVIANFRRELRLTQLINGPRDPQ